MVHFPDLQLLNLRNTGITSPPAGLFRLERLTKADLSHNRIRGLPFGFPARPDVMMTEYDFSANPLSPVSQQRLESYNKARREHNTEMRLPGTRVWHEHDDSEAVDFSDDDWLPQPGGNWD